jgi:virginiamycin B lyase
LDSKVVKFNASAIDGGIGSMHEYPTKTSSSSPGWITTGPDKNLWFTEPGVDKIGTMTTSGTANDFMGPLVTNSLGAGQIATGPDGALWFTEENPGGGSASAGHRIARVTTAGSITQEYAFTNTFTEPAGIVTGPDGALWFAEYCNNAIGRLDPNTKTLVEFSLPNTGSYPWGIVKGPDGALWFTEYIGNRIGKLQ